MSSDVDPEVFVAGLRTVWSRSHAQKAAGLSVKGAALSMLDGKRTARQRTFRKVEEAESRLYKVSLAISIANHIACDAVLQPCTLYGRSLR